MGIKMANMAADHSTINYKTDRLRITKEEKQTPMEKQLKTYFKQASLYSGPKGQNQTEPERNFRRYVDNHVNTLSRINVENLKRKIINSNLAASDQMYLMEPSTDFHPTAFLATTKHDGSTEKALSQSSRPVHDQLDVEEAKEDEASYGDEPLEQKSVFSMSFDHKVRSHDQSSQPLSDHSQH